MAHSLGLSGLTLVERTQGRALHNGVGHGKPFGRIISKGERATVEGTDGPGHIVAPPQANPAWEYQCTLRL